MTILKINIPHRLTEAEALKRIKNLLKQMVKDHRDQITTLKEKWRASVGTFSFVTRGFTVSGTVTVTPSSVEIMGELPFAFSLFKRKITAVITETASKLLR